MTVHVLGLLGRTVREPGCRQPLGIVVDAWPGELAAPENVVVVVRWEPLSEFRNERRVMGSLVEVTR